LNGGYAPPLLESEDAHLIFPQLSTINLILEAKGLAARMLASSQ